MGHAYRALSIVALAGFLLAVVTTGLELGSIRPWLQPQWLLVVAFAVWLPTALLVRQAREASGIPNNWRLVLEGGRPWYRAAFGVLFTLLLMTIGMMMTMGPTTAFPEGFVITVAAMVFNGIAAMALDAAATRVQPR
jgi:hypothetical protein